LSGKKNKGLSLSCCNEDHKPVWFYDDHSCPLCAAKILIEDYESDLQDIRELLLDSETEIDRLRGALSETKND
jgi:hypothetical protein